MLSYIYASLLSGENEIQCWGVSQLERVACIILLWEKKKKEKENLYETKLVYKKWGNHSIPDDDIIVEGKSNF